MKRLAPLLLLSASAAALSPLPTPPHTQRVNDYIAAFNRQDVEAMLDLVSTEVQWLSIAGDQAPTKEVEGRSALRQSLTDYFGACPSCRSHLGQVLTSNERVVVLETASWTTPEGQSRQQQALAVYEFEPDSGKIARVYYFPVER